MDKINAAATKQNRKIVFMFGNGDVHVAHLSDFMSLIHPSIDKLDLNAQDKSKKSNGHQNDHEDSSAKGVKRKLESVDKTSSSIKKEANIPITSNGIVKSNKRK